MTALFLLLQLASPDYDLIIRNARIIDGTGASWFAGDIAIKDGQIAGVGRLPSAKSRRTIDATGLYAAPGFIDVHTHVEGDIDKRPGAENFLLDGVTTVVTGNCGSSRLNLGDWFRSLEQARLAINVASLAGHNSIRREVMGTADRAPGADEQSRMNQLVAAAMQQGAVGLSSGLEYVPGAYAKQEELTACARVAGEFGGVYATHMRSEGAQLLDAIRESAEIGRFAGTPVQISHLKVDNKRFWGASDKAIELIEKYRREGVDVAADMYPYDRSSTTLTLPLPRWALADGKLVERLRDPDTRARIKTEMAEMLKAKGQPNYSYAMVASYRPDRSLEGKTISEINVAKGRPAAVDAEIDTILEMLDADDASMVYHSMNDEDVERFLKYPNTAIASDGSVREPGVGMPHPRSYGTNARVLAEFVRVRRVITLEDAVRRMTSLPARTFGFTDRGILRPGMAADIVVFDAAKVQDKSTFRQPHQYSEGFAWVVVNGLVAVESGKATEARGGRILRGPGARLR